MRWGVFIFLTLFLPLRLIAEEPRTTSPAPWEMPGPGQLDLLVHWRLVYETPRGVFLLRDNEAQSRLIVPGGKYPRFSPDGLTVAVIRKNEIIELNLSDNSERHLAELSSPRALGYRPDGKELFYTDGKRIRAVDLTGLSIRDIVSGRDYRELDLSPDGRTRVATVKWLGTRIYLYDLQSGGEKWFAKGCSASFSPDGKLISRNTSSHKVLDLLDRDSGMPVAFVPAPPGSQFDNHFWSNDQDWLVSRTEETGRENIFVHWIAGQKVFQLTSGGAADRPDFFVESTK